jgi:ABC-type amino acid transport substrate-binding protein
MHRAKFSFFILFFVLFGGNKGLEAAGEGSYLFDDQRCQTMRVGGGSWLDADKNKDAMAFLSKALLTTFSTKYSLNIVYTAQAPFARQLKQLEAGELDLVVGLYPVAQRLEKYLFSDVYLDEALFVFARENVLADIRDIDDLKKYMGVIVRGASYGKELDQFYLLNPHKTYAVRQQLDGLYMVELDRADYYIAANYAPGIQKQLPEYIKQSQFPISSPGVAFAMSKLSRCQAWLTQLNQLINELLIKGEKTTNK